MLCQYDCKRDIGSTSLEYINSALRRSFNCKSVELRGQILMVDLVEDVSQEKFSEIIQNLLFVSKNLERKTTYSNKVSHPYSGNPMLALLESGDVIQTGPGIFSFQGAFLNVLKSCERYFESVATRLQAVEQRYPTLWPVDLYKKINYFSEFPQQIILSAALENDYSSRENFAKKYHKDEQYSSVNMEQDFAHSHFGMQCAVCDTCYYNIRGSRNYPNSLFTTHNRVYRNEKSPTDSLDRLTEFTVRDIMFVGSKEHVLEYRQHMLNEAENLLAGLDLESKIETADDPFFTNDTVMKNLFQSSAELKYELQVKLNHSGAFIAVGSVNTHLDFFGESFDIRLEDESYAYSGCTGIGFERLAYALYCQYGEKTDNWPAQVRSMLNL